MAQMGFVAPEVAGPIIQENLSKSLELDPDFAASHYTQGVIGVWVEWNWEKGEQEFLRALELNPNDAMSRILLCTLAWRFFKEMMRLSLRGNRRLIWIPLNPLILALNAVVVTGLCRSTGRGSLSI